ncbi:hypothetical protein GCM10008022_12690 [Paenibacillus hunanensis]|nr:hypothetical protein GCM10008022_12690 [Paenibacillus hunanensis]
MLLKELLLLLRFLFDCWGLIVMVLGGFVAYWNEDTITLVGVYLFLISSGICCLI